MTIPRLLFAAAALSTSLTLVTNLSAATVSLASQMAVNGGITENAVTGSVARIEYDPNGLYDINDESQSNGTVAVFSNGANFNIGSFDFNLASVTGSGVETVAITDLNTSGFWQDGSATTDVSDVGLGLWFFDLPNQYVFSSFDAADTATFTDGLLTSIDATVDMQYVMADGGGNAVTWSGTLTLAGANIALNINDTQQFDTGPLGGGIIVPSTLTNDFVGTVNAVGTYHISAVPEPGSLLALALVGGTVACRRRRRA